VELINTHCHTGYCGPAEGEVAPYVACAKQAGLSTLAFTDHYPLSSQYDLGGYLSVPEEKIVLYREAVLQARADNPDMEIILGCELDYLGSCEDRVLQPEDLAPYELVLGSVHFVDGWAFDDPAERDEWEKPGAADRIWRRYFELWCDAVSDRSMPFQVMSHPDLAKKFNFYPTYDVKPLYEAAVEACKASGRMIELNTSGSYYACAEVFPSPELLAMFAKAGVPCTVGTDAHVPENVARDIKLGYKHMYEAGYREVTVPTASGDRRTITIV